MTIERKDEALDNFYSGKRILITAGPTVEPIDDVRFISNRSSGKMGYALAKTASDLGATVTLVSGPVHLSPPDRITTINVQTAQEMYQAAIDIFPNTDIAIMSAAVADFAPAAKANGKIKKENIGDEMIIRLKKTKDILAELSATKNKNQIVVGFALESENEIDNGIKKLQRKKCDMIVVNSTSKPDSGFDGEKNTITIITATGNSRSFPPMLKSACAVEIFKMITEL